MRGPLPGPPPQAGEGRAEACISGATVRDFFADLAQELEGYDDIHATAAMRRDLLVRLGPSVVEEAWRCAA
jgi:hypothetical protein